MVKSFSTQDDLGREVRIHHWPPRRIISLCPSQTETLYTLGLDQEIAGVTEWCVRPEQKAPHTISIGGTKKPDIKKIRDLVPDLVIAEKEENDRESIEAISTFAPVYVTDVTDQLSALRMIATLGEITGRSLEAVKLIASIAGNWRKFPTMKVPLRVVYLIWRKPWMAAGYNTYISHILEIFGVRNLALDLPGRYPEITAEWLQDVQPDWIMLADEPFPFSDKFIPELREVCRNARIDVVDGQMFSWYGARMLDLPDYLREIQGRLVSRS